MTAPTPIEELLKAMILKAPEPVYPGYIASTIKRALLKDTERVIVKADDIVSLGMSRYLVRLTDFNGQVYRVTVEMDDACSKSAELHDGIGADIT